MKKLIIQLFVVLLCFLGWPALADGTEVQMKKAAQGLVGGSKVGSTLHHLPFSPQFTWEMERVDGKLVVKISFYFPSFETWQIQVSTVPPVLSGGNDPWQPMRSSFFETFELGPNRITYTIDPKAHTHLFLRAFLVQ